MILFANTLCLKSFLMRFQAFPHSQLHIFHSIRTEIEIFLDLSTLLWRLFAVLGLVVGLRGKFELQAFRHSLCLLLYLVVNGGG